MVDQTVLAELAAFVETCDFPCTKQDLLDQAEDQNAIEEVVNLIEKLPEQDYLSETYVIEAVQGI